MPPCRAAERGQILLLALLVLVLFSFALTLLGFHLREQQRALDKEGESIRLTAMVDAALAEALARFARDPGFRGEGEHDFADGKIESELRRLSDEEVEITVHATRKGRRRTAVARVATTGIHPQVVDWRLVPQDGR